MLETAVIIEAIHYLLKTLGPADKIKIIKLIYLADKYHLVRYGRTVTGDDYCAMEYGLVGSAVKDILGFDRDLLSKEEYSYASKLLERIDNKTFKARNERISLHMLSKTDIEALSFVIQRFGKMATWKLSDYTHQYPEWQKYEDLFKNKKTKRERIETRELLSVLEDDPLGMPKEHREESAKLVSGTYD